MEPHPVPKKARSDLQNAKAQCDGDVFAAVSEMSAEAKTQLIAEYNMKLDQREKLTADEVHVAAKVLSEYDVPLYTEFARCARR